MAIGGTSWLRHNLIGELQHRSRSCLGGLARHDGAVLGCVATWVGVRCSGYASFFMLRAWAGTTWVGVVNGPELAWVRLGCNYSLIMSYEDGS